MNLIIGFLPASTREFIQLQGRVGRVDDKPGKFLCIYAGDFDSEMELVRKQEGPLRTQILNKVRALFKEDVEGEHKEDQKEPMPCREVEEEKVPLYQEEEALEAKEGKEVEMAENIQQEVR